MQIVTAPRASEGGGADSGLFATFLNARFPGQVRWYTTNSPFKFGQSRAGQ